MTATKTAVKHLYIAFGRNGTFPHDMLRYDKAKVLAGPLKRTDLNPDLNLASSEVWDYYVIAGEVPPTVGRWQSFIWGVVEF